MSATAVLPFSFGDIRIDPAALAAFRAGRALDLEPKSLRVLLFLVENRGRVVPKEELLQSVWSDAFVTDNALTRVIAQLRKALGDDARQARYIETVPTVGYRFIAEVVPEPSVPPPGSPARRRWTVAVLVAAFGFAAAGLGAWRLLDRAPPPAARKHGSRTTQMTASPGLDFGPTFSPDGSSIAYATDRGGGFEIYLRPLALEGREVAITSDGGQNIQPAWSPDGQYIAYHSLARGGIHVVPALGGFPRRVSSFGSAPAWSPDGSRIAFRGERAYSLALPDLAPGGESRIWVAPSAGGDARAVTQPGPHGAAHSAPIWSADGRRIVFIDHLVPGFVSELACVDLSSGARHSIHSAASLLLSARLAPGGGALYFADYSPVGESGVWRMPLDSAAMRPTGPPAQFYWPGVSYARDLAVSSDGRRLAFALTTMSSNLESLPLSPVTGLPTGPPRAVTADTSVRNSLPAISPDGSRIAYYVRRKGILGDIWTIGVEGADPRPVTTHPFADYLPNWTPDGRAVVYGSNRDGGHRLWMTSLDTGQERIFAGPAGLKRVRARLSPDGRHAAYHRNEDGRMVLYRMDLVSGEEKSLTPPGESIGYATWSRDGKWIAVERRRGDETYLAVLPASGGKIEQLTREPAHSWVYSWSPGDDRLAFAGLRDGVWNVFWISRSTRRQERLTNLASPRAFVRYPEWSPKGERMIYERTETRGNIFVMDIR